MPLKALHAASLIAKQRASTTTAAGPTSTQFSTAGTEQPGVVDLRTASLLLLLHESFQRAAGRWVHSAVRRMQASCARQQDSTSVVLLSMFG